MLRPYQQECLNTILSRRAAGIRRQLVSMATGTGKSLLFGALPQHMPVGKRTLMLVHTRELVVQGAEHLRRWNPGLKVGIEMARESTEGEQIVVASVQTIGRSLSERIGKFKPEDFEWVVCDEAHRSISQTYQNVFDHFGMFEDPNGPALVGLTATPSRSDGVAMGTVYQEIVYTYNILDAVSDGWLSDVCGIKLHTGADLTKVSTKAGDFDQTELADAVNTPERNAAIVKAWIDYAWPRRTIIFCADIAHAKEIVKGFNSSGIPADAIWGADKDRADKLRKHKSGELTVLACAQLLVEGYDDPEIECVIMGRPTKSQTFFIQACGRGTRLGAGIGNLKEWREKRLLTDQDKTNCLLIDCADVTGRHSLVSLPSLFGLSPNLDLEGQSIVAAVQAIKSALAAHPQADVSGLERMSDLDTHVQSVNLWRVRFAEEVQGFSELQWVKRGDGSYRILLPKNDAFRITEDMVGKFSVDGVLKGQKYSMGNVATLADAVAFAERTITSEAPEHLILLGREQRWMKSKITSPQMKMLERLRVPAEQIARMTRGEAAAFITSRFNKRS